MTTREDLSVALLNFLNVNSAFKWELGEAPAMQQFPYGIIYPVVHMPTWTASLVQSAAASWSHWQMTMVGRSTKQVLWASDRAKATLLDYSKTLPVSLREIVTLGAVVRGSTDIYSVNDTYRFLLVEEQQ